MAQELHVSQNCIRRKKQSMRISIKLCPLSEKFWQLLTYGDTECSEMNQLECWHCWIQSTKEREKKEFVRSVSLHVFQRYTEIVYSNTHFTQSHSIFTSKWWLWYLAGHLGVQINICISTTLKQCLTFAVFTKLWYAKIYKIAAKC